jgi:hypothetical protein
MVSQTTPPSSDFPRKENLLKALWDAFSLPDLQDIRHTSLRAAIPPTLAGRILAGLLFGTLLIGVVYQFYREFFSTPAYYSREGAVLGRWTWSTPPWYVNGPPPTANGSYETDSTTQPGVVIRARLKTGLVACQAAPIAGCIAGHIRIPLSAEFVVIRNPIGHTAAQLYQPRGDRREKRLTQKYAARIFPPSCGGTANRMNDDPVAVVSVDCGLLLKTPVAEYPAQGASNYLFRRDNLLLRLHGDGRITLLSSDSNVSGGMLTYGR